MKFKKPTWPCGNVMSIPCNSWGGSKSNFTGGPLLTRCLASANSCKKTRAMACSFWSLKQTEKNTVTLLSPGKIYIHSSSRNGKLQGGGGAVFCCTAINACSKGAAIKFLFNSEHLEIKVSGSSGKLAMSKHRLNRNLPPPPL